MRRRTRSLLMCGSAALALAAAPANHDPVHAATKQVVALSGPRVSVVDAARTVVTFDAKGDIRGLLTLSLVRGTGEKGAPSLTGEWALVSRYVRDMLTGDEDLGPTGEDSGYAHKERLAFVERGTIHGAVTGGMLGFDSNGQLDSLESLRLQVAGGNLDFAGALGSGSASGASLQSEAYGSGTLVLATEVAE
jgi:hypothetical protein